MIIKLKEFFSTEPEKIIEWQDDYTPAVGWLVINSLRGGAAGGGTRMRSDCKKEEVIELAKTMEIKFTVSGPAIGGAKSGICYDFHNDEEKKSVLRRWFKFILPELQTHYGTGGDQNVDLVKDVEPLLNEWGILHPQEGIVRGHFSGLPKGEQNRLVNNLKIGVNLPIVSDSFLQDLNYKIADVSTGYGVTSSIKHFLKFNGEEVKGKKIIVEGFGNVGGAAAYYLNKLGAKIVGIIEKDWYAFDDNGLDIPAILKDWIKGFSYVQKNSSVFLFKKGERVLEELPLADIFVTAATSHTLNSERLSHLKQSGIKLIANGANNPFVSTTIEESADKDFIVIPDFIANCGMARVFSYLMDPGCVLNESAVLDDINNCIVSALEEIFAINNSANLLTEHALSNALSKIEDRVTTK